MGKSIEKIIEDAQIPEMEYTKPAKPKKRSVSFEEEVPEIVLPKTKAEMYEEAKGRLTEKTTAASKAYKPRQGGKKKPPIVKTVDLEAAAAKAAAAASIRQREAEKKNVEELRKRMTESRKPVEPKWVGSADELVPFAWRHPLIEVEKPSKYYRNAVRTEK